jgi:cytochrome b561
VDTPAWVRLLAGFSHASLYALLVLMPITGFLATNAWGFPLKVFEVLPLPSPIGKDEAIAKALSFTHWCGAVSMGTLLAAHVAGGLYHRFMARDALSRRMF